MTEPVRASDIENANRELREARAQAALKSSIIEATLQFAAKKAAKQAIRIYPETVLPTSFNE